ncbi:TPA: phage tail tape measure protein [Klebsiella michiganensis]|uniref:phage tail tape measure protein n=2 Tax=Klebsiella michiganensis TaxID=1134687 RepID=UPI0015618DBB|nr:phage tail tape measure protein [Klebsiella michiganensis]NRG20292.1 phage tail tape measure protein [Klebsiella michiganensis]
MAGKSLGTLTIDLIAKVGGFVQGMDKAERSSQKWREQVKKDAKAVGASIAAIGVAAATAAVGIGLAGLAIVKSTAQQVTEADRWAKSLKMSTQDLLSWQYAAEQADLTGDNIADIFKDINDKVGDAVLNKSGEAAQALDTLGLSAEKLSKQSPDKQLMAISEALQKIPTQAGKTNILESLGNDLSKMLPLFDNNNEKLKQFIQLSKDFGVAPPQEDIDNLVKVNRFFQDIETSVRGLKIEIASGLAKVDLSPIQNGLNDIREVFTDPAVLSGLAKLVGGMAELVGWMGKLSSESANFISHIFEVPDRFKAGGWYEFEKNQRLGAIADTLQSDLGVITKPSSNFALPVNNNLLPGQSNQKQTEKKDPTAAKLQNAFKSVEQSYLQQIALVDQLTGKTKNATEVEKLHFDIASGRLVGLNKAQQTRLEGLASEVDKYNALSKFRDLQDELLTPEEKLLKTTKERFKVLKDIQGLPGVSQEEVKKATKAITEDSFADMPNFTGIDPMFGGQLGELRKVDDAQKEQEKWYQNQLELLEQNRQARSDLNEEWDARELELKKKHQDEMNRLDDARNQLMLSSVVDGLGSMVDMTRTAFGEQSGIYKAAFAVQKAAAIAQSIIAIQQGIAMAAANPFPYNLAAMASVAASTASIVSNISAVGMAHDGLDSVPETGTWLLQKGERVTTANTSAKLDATLDRVSKDTTGGKLPDVHISTTVNGDPDQRTLLLLKETQKQAVQEALNLSANQIATGTGKIGKAMGSGWSTGRKLT